MPGGGQAGGPGLEAGNRQVGDLPGRVPGEALGLPGHGGGAGVEGMGDVAAAVMHAAGIGQEDIAPLYLPAVGGHAPGGGGQTAQFIRQLRHLPLATRRSFHVHTASGTTGAAPGGALCWSKGASGGTAMKRRAPAMTRENTGAATRPP